MAEKRRRKRREDLSEEEIRRLRARRKRKKIMRIKRRIYGGILLIIIILVLVFVIKNRNKDGGESVSENSVLPSSGAADSTESIGGGYEGEMTDSDPFKQDEAADMYYGVSYNGVAVMNLAVPLDVTSGRAAVDLSSVSMNNVSKVQAAKQAMAKQAYFAGTSRTVNDCMESYGDGKWHAIVDISGDVCAFYDGVHIESNTYTDVSGNTVTSYGNEAPFKVTFIIFEDGSFVVQSVEKDGALVDDYRAFLEQIVNR